MIRLILAAAMLCALFAMPAEARPKHRVKAPAVECFIFCPPVETGRASPRARSRAVRGADPRPHRWCAWWLRRKLGIARSAFRPGEYNLARAFRYIGSSAHGPAAGVIVVWRHHVGEITGRAPDGRWIVLSGNDGNAVRERPRSLRGAIAYRWPHGAMASRGQAL